MMPLWSGTGTFANYENAAMRIVARGEEIALEVALPGDSSYTETSGQSLETASIHRQTNTSLSNSSRRASFHWRATAPLRAGSPSGDEVRKMNQGFDDFSTLCLTR